MELLNADIKTGKLPIDIARKLNNYIQSEKYIDAYKELVEYLSKLGEKSVKTIVDSINSEASLSASYKSLIASFDISSYIPKLTGFIEVNGSILDQFAIEEFETKEESYLAVATTINKYHYTIEYYAIPKPTSKDSSNIVTYYICRLINETNEQVCERISIHINTTETQEINHEYSSYVFYINTDKWEWTNSIYIVKPGNLEIISELSELAPGERVYSARIIKSTLYLVTFRRIDPLFAIDLSNPEKPAILGYLKIPGFSEYLHPVNENLLLGIGREDLSIKVSLFNVSNPKNIIEKTTLKINGYSPLVDSDDYHAFLFDNRYSLCYLPIQVTDEPGINVKTSGVLIIHIDTKNSVIDQKLRIVEHAEAIRAIYIENKLYTVSFKSIRTWSLPNVGLIDETFFD
jgi:Secreted protein containing C-terminal beta-propeller domain distantly related to WD-40 repeats